MNIESYSSKVKKAQIANDFPIEKIIADTYERVVASATSGEDLKNKLPVILWLCKKGLRILPAEIDVRGATEVLAAIEKVEKIEASVKELQKSISG